MLGDLEDREKRLLGIMGFAAMGLIAALTLSSIWFGQARRIPVPPAPDGLVMRETQIIRVIASSARPVRMDARPRGRQDAGAPVTILVTRDYPRVSFQIIGGLRLRELELPTVAELALDGDPEEARQRAAENPYHAATIRVGGVRVNGETLVDPEDNYRHFRRENRRRALWGWLFLGGALVPLAVFVLAGRKLLRG